MTTETVATPSFAALFTLNNVENALAPTHPNAVNRRIAMLALTKDSEELCSIADDSPQTTLIMLAAAVSTIETAKAEQEMAEAAKWRLMIALAGMDDSECYQGITTMAESGNFDGLMNLAESMPEDTATVD